MVHPVISGRKFLKEARLSAILQIRQTGPYQRPVGTVGCQLVIMNTHTLGSRNKRLSLLKN